MKKPSDFIIPCDWDSRKPFLLEKCLYVPAHYEGHQGFNLTWDAVFEKSQPIQVEFCSGNGEWIAEMAKKSPETNWIAVERDFDRARKIWLKIFRLKLNNLFVVFGEGLTFSTYYVSDASISGVFVNFPDPWPKRRHAKHRLIRASFVQQMSRILCNKGPITLVTDDAAYSDVIVREFSAWKSEFAPPCYVTEWPEFGSSYFYSLWKQKGRIIRYHRFING